MGTAWNGISYQQSVAAGGAGVFGLSLLLVFLILAALYESWSLPFSVLLSVPVAVCGAFFGLWSRHFDNDVYAQVVERREAGERGGYGWAVVHFGAVRRYSATASFCVTGSTVNFPCNYPAQL